MIEEQSTEVTVETTKVQEKVSTQFQTLQVHDSTFQMDLITKKLDSQRGLGEQERERQLDKREKMIRQTEEQLSIQQKEVETQRVWKTGMA